MEKLKPNHANSSPMTPLGFLERAATVYGGCPSVIYNEKVQTWSETYTRCLRLASSITARLGGVAAARGRVVSVVAPNVPAMYELHFAVPMSGAVLNTINTRLDPNTVSVLLRHSGAALVFADRLSAAEVFPESSPSLAPVILIEDEYEEMVERGDPGFRWVLPESEWDPIILNYTSGTTSSPKGVVHCHRGIFCATVGSLVDWAVTKQPVFLWTLPMFHANGWCFPWGIAAVGGTNIMLRRFDPELVFSLIRRHHVTHMCGAPVVLNMLSNSPHAVKLENPVQLLTAGAPPPSEVLRRAEAMGFVVSHGYGLTETAGIVVSCAWKPEWDRRPEEERARLKARQGVRTAATSEVDVVDPTTELTVKKDGQTLGEIVVRGSCVMLGYLKDPHATSSAISKSGWLYTGDVGVFHPDGYLEIKDRSKDVIISGGENVSSVEVESVLYGHPKVAEAAVVARPDDLWGETPCAFVTLRPGTTAATTLEEEIMEYCRRKLPRYMVPKTVVVKDELPKTSTGKIQKYLLKEVAKSLGSSGRSRM